MRAWYAAPGTFAIDLGLRSHKMGAMASSFVEILSVALFLGGAGAAFLLLRHARRHPVRRAALDDALAARAWNSAQLAVVLGVLFLLHFAAAFTGRFFYEEQLPFARMVVTVAIYAIMVAVVRAAGRGVGGMGLRRWRTLGLAMPFYLALMPFVMVASKVWQTLLEQATNRPVELQEVAQTVGGEWSWLRLAYILVAVFGAPVYEELIFRGILFPYLAKRAGLAGGVVATSLVFALVHLHLPSMVPLGLLSAALCLAYWRTGSLWPSIGMHMLFNAVSILAISNGA